VLLFEVMNIQGRLEVWMFILIPSFIGFITILSDKQNREKIGSLRKIHIMLFIIYNLIMLADIVLFCIMPTDFFFIIPLLYCLFILFIFLLIIKGQKRWNTEEIILVVLFILLSFIVFFCFYKVGFYFFAPKIDSLGICPFLGTIII